MTDIWGEAVERLNAAASPAPEPQPAAVSEPSSWPLYATPATPPSEAQPADPLILELERSSIPHASAEAAPEVASSVFGHVEPQALNATPPESGRPELVHSEPAHREPTHSEPALEPAPPVPVVAETAAPAPLAAVPAVAPSPEPLMLTEPLVARAEKPVEPAPQQAEPDPLTAPLTLTPVVAALSPQPARPSLTEAPIPHASDPHDGIDPVLAGFDHVVALAGYVLLFISVFMFGVPALATMALAYAHKNDSHLLVRSHYRFQLRIFWTAILFALLAIGSAVTAGGLAVSKLFDFVREHLPGVGAAMDRAGASSWSAEVAGLLLIGAITLGALAVIWTLVASLFGFLRLLGNRPIGHQ